MPLASEKVGEARQRARLRSRISSDVALGSGASGGPPRFGPTTPTKFGSQLPIGSPELSVSSDGLENLKTKISTHGGTPDPISGVSRQFILTPDESPLFRVLAFWFARLSTELIALL